MQSLLYYPFDMEDNTLTANIDSDAELQALEAFLDEYNAEERGTEPIQAPANEAYTNTLESAMEIEASSESSGSEDTTDSLHNSSCGTPGTATLNVRQPTPVRRDYRKEEMTRLRWMVQHLTKKFKLLQTTPAQAPRPPKAKEAKEEHLDKATDPRKESLWQQIARKQRERRRKSEEENTNLRNMVYTQVLEAKNLRRILKRRARIEMLEQMLGVKRRKDLSRSSTTPQDNAQVFQNMLREADELYPGVERLFARKRIDDILCPGRKRHVWLNANGGTKFELTQKNLVPFGLQDTERAMWSSLCRLGSSSLQHTVDANAQVYVTVQHSEEKEDVMMASFVASVPGAKDMSGMQIRKVVRRYVKADGTVFICRALIEPTCEANRVAVRTSSTAQVVVKRATNLGAGEDEELSLILSHLTVSSHFESDVLGPTTIEENSTIAIWDGVLSRIANDVENFLLDESLQKAPTQALGEG